LPLELQGHVSVRAILGLVSFYMRVGAIEHETTRHQVFLPELSPNRFTDCVINRDIFHGFAGIGHAAMAEASAEEASVAWIRVV
jgi:hypothetical protein